MRNIRYHLYILLSFLLVSFACKAQFVSAELGVNGLTCSACTRSVEMSIRKLDFVQDVQMNLDNTNGVITFKPGSDVSIEKLAKAVVDAGFSVRYLQATFKSDSTLHISDNMCFAYDNANYQFVEVGAQQPNNSLVMKFIGKEFQETKEYKKWKADLKPVCTGMKNTYYITL